MTPKPDKADVLLINPPSGLFYGLGPNFAPIGLFSLAAFLRAHGFAVTVLNANYYPDYQSAAHSWSGYGRRRADDYYYAEDGDNPVWAQTLAFIELTDPKLVGFSCHDLAVGGIKRLASALKAEGLRPLTAVGGPTPSGAPDIFDDCPAVDYLLAGEGEAVLLELVQALRDNGWRRLAPGRATEAIAGLYRHDGRKFVPTAARPPLADLDALPPASPDYYWLDYERGRIVKDVQLNGLTTSRGCLKACRFCGAKTIWPGPTRYRSIGRVIEEAADLRKKYGYDFQHFSIFDDDFLARPERVFDFCRRLKELKDDYKFRCYGRVDNLQDEEIIETLLQAGCQEIWVGVESGSQKVLKALGKGITVPQIKRLDRLFHNYDFPWLAFIILGTPSEDERDFQATLNMLKEGHFPSIQPFAFQPYTGSDLFRQLREEGRLGYDDIIRSHQNLPRCFSRLAAPARFWERLKELKQLARTKGQAWLNDFHLSEEEAAAARQWERRAADWLEGRSGRFLALGPERQLRWLAALKHYRGLQVDLRLLDVAARAVNITRFGRILAGGDFDGPTADGLIIAAPDGQTENWRAQAGSLFPGLPVRVLGSDSAGLSEGGKKYWRPVYELCRQAPGG
ncbi:MAG: B12-binding domain-containing radical SAM protein [Candidatus Adiutrix sp.]|jgi:radical SAM superfamily enzyme YgiQ (UPF0313 family)|nr:B12-binding domain-containing radical SAM protein [Candidatus Adiutrix sp.]